MDGTEEENQDAWQQIVDQCRQQTLRLIRVNVTENLWGLGACKLKG